jgi:hypothetical protein
VLAVKALRELGAARESAYFATAPFIGTIASMVIFRELPTWLAVIGAIAMLAGVVVIMREQHGHTTHMNRSCMSIFTFTTSIISISTTNSHFQNRTRTRTNIARYGMIIHLSDSHHRHSHAS